MENEKIREYIINGEAIGLNINKVVNYKGLEWARKNGIITHTEQSKIILTMGSFEQEFESLIVSVYSLRAGKSETILVKLSEELTLVLGQFGNRYKAPLYLYE